MYFFLDMKHQQQQFYILLFSWSFFFVDFSIFLFKFSFSVDKFSRKTTLEFYGFIFPYMNLIQKCTLVNLLRAWNNSITMIYSVTECFFLLTQPTKETSINGNFPLDKSSNQSLMFGCECLCPLWDKKNKRTVFPINPFNFVITIDLFFRFVCFPPFLS